MRFEGPSYIYKQQSVSEPQYKRYKSELHKIVALLNMLVLELAGRVPGVGSCRIS